MLNRRCCIHTAEQAEARSKRWCSRAPRSIRSRGCYSGVLAQTPYSFKTRFESEKGTNPEELIAAAHAGCFTMALAFQLQGGGYTPTELSTEAAVTLDPEGQGGGC